MGSFQFDFYRTISRFYRCFGVSPNPSNKKRSRPILSWISIIVFLVVYWIATIYLIWKKKEKGDIISAISNYIQSFVNAVTFSVVIISHNYHYQDYFNILSILNSIDDTLSDLGHKINYKSTLVKVYVVLFTFFGVLIAKTVYEACVFVVKYEMFTMQYWMFQSVPIVIYLICLSEAILLVHCILQRCRKLTSILTLNPNRPTGNGHVQIVLVQPETTQIEIETKLKLAFKFMEQIQQLCERFNNFFGLSLLFIITSMFTVTAIQSFYCYTIYKDLYHGDKRTLWTLFGSSNVVTFNIICISVMSYYSDMVTVEAHRVNTTIRKLRESLSHKCHNCLHFVMENIKISAFLFFNINCTFLGGFFSALITYVLVMVQCNEIGGNNREPPMQLSGDLDKIRAGYGG